MQRHLKTVHRWKSGQKGRRPSKAKASLVQLWVGSVRTNFVRENRIISQTSL
jgi:hypothetical protein